MFFGIGGPFAHLEREIAPLETVGFGRTPDSSGVIVGCAPVQIGPGYEVVTRFVPHPASNTTPSNTTPGKRNPLRV